MSAFNTASSTLLSQGVSTQPRHVRLPGQVESSLNMLYSVLDGASTRSGAEFLGTVGPFTFSNNFSMEIVVLSDGTEYAVVHGFHGSPTPQYTISIFKVSGWETVGVTVTPEAQAYLDLATNSKDIRIRTSADTTFLVNRKVSPGLMATPGYSVDFIHRDFDVLLSYTPKASGTYHRTLRDVPLSPAGYWKHNDGGVTYPMVQLVKDSTKSATEPGEGSVVEDYTGLAADRAGARFSFRRENLLETGVQWTQATKRLFKSGAFANLSLIADPGGVGRARTQIQVTGGTALAVGWYTVVAKINDNTVEIDTDIGPDAADASLDGIRNEFQAIIPTKVAYQDMHAVALALQDELRLSGAGNAMIGWVDLGGDRGRFTVTSPYRGVKAAAYEPLAPGVAGVHDLTDSANAVSPLKFAYTPQSAQNGVGTDDGTDIPPEARWIRVAAPNDPDGQIDPETMPVLMVPVPGSPLTFVVDVVQWNMRQSGTGLTNPAPDPIVRGEPIVDALVVGGRLALGSGSSIMFSADADLFRLFINDATNLVDSDPFTVPLSGTRLGGVHSLVSLSSSLSVFTTGGLQFEVRPPFVETQVVVSSTSGIEIGSTLPVRMGESILFAGPTGSASALYEYAYFDSAGSFIANDVSKHVFGLLPSNIGDLDASWSGTSAVAVSGTSDRFTVYQRFVRDSQRLQAAYAPCRIYANGLESSIRAVSVVGDDAYFLVAFNHAPLQGADPRVYRVPLARASFTPWQSTAGPGYVPVLDGMARSVGVFLGGSPGETAFAYHPSTDGTGPSLNPDMVDTIVFSNGTIYRRGDPEWGESGGVITIAGNHNGVEAAMGSSVESWLVATPPVPRDQSGDPLFGTALAVNRVLAMVPHTATATTFSLSASSQQPSGMIQIVGSFPGSGALPGSLVLSTPFRPEIGPLKISSVSPIPTSVQSLWYEGQTVSRT